MMWPSKTDKKIERLHASLVESFGNVRKDTHSIRAWLNYLYQRGLEQEKHIALLRQELSRANSPEDSKTVAGRETANRFILEKISLLNAKIESIKASGSADSEQCARRVSGMESALQGVKLSIKKSEYSEERLHALSVDIASIRSEQRQNLEELGVRIESLRRRLDSDREPVVRRLAELEERFNSIKASIGQGPSSGQDLNVVVGRLEKLEERKNSAKEKFIKKIAKDSREYLKGIILSYIKKYGRISAMQLKEMLVEEQGICSKSSFYRMLEEIEAMDDIAILRKGKEKHYMAKASVKNQK